ncbi:cupin domain-containing protein [Propionibacterium freudenreichii]|nr:cupin [Propionibacterium freudenreichii]PWM95378.1 MAG: cupin domain-containing protein [Propionibacterium sp.]MCT2973066.1 cupin domain-containing protein [Propionibacterium freudenreichii]MCT2976825.1 cupin domain-containing protein [Propionibacterium freudenreichii]MCT2978142.1 cupin domain-containing protein [Propionibacterium freudenreichii]
MMAQQTPVTQAGVFTNLASELPVVPKSTTSRVVLDNDLIRVVEFTFDAGELLTEHASPRAVVVQLLEGTMSFTVDGAESTLHVGDVVYLAPGTPHALVATTACRMSLVMVEAGAHLAGEN